MAVPNFNKVRVRPSVLTPDEFYLVENGDYAEFFVADHAGNAREVGNSRMINDRITEYIHDHASSLTGVPVRVVNETPTGDINGFNALFLSQFDFKPESVEVWISGFKLALLHDYNTNGTRTVMLYSSPLPGELLLINYTRQ